MENAKIMQSNFFLSHHFDDLTICHVVVSPLSRPPTARRKICCPITKDDAINFSCTSAEKGKKLKFMK